MRNLETLTARLCRDVEQRIKRLQRRSLAVLKAGDPDEAPTIRLCTCHKAGQIKISACECRERVSFATCSRMIQEGQADWVRYQKRNGVIGVYRLAIAFTSKAEHGDSGEAINPLVAILVEQPVVQSFHEAELTLKDQKKIAARKKKSIKDMVRIFRKELTPEEDACWSDEKILYAVEHIEHEPRYLLGIGLHNKIDSTLDEASKQGRLVTVVESDFYKTMADDSRVSAALLKASYYYHRIILAAEGLSDRQSKLMPDAPEGRGLPVSGGYNEAKLAQIDIHNQEILDENGKPQNGRHLPAANFIPGSGGMEYATEGGNRESFDPIWTVGTSPDIDGPGDDHESKQEAQVEAPPDNMFKQMGSQKAIAEKLSVKSLLEQPRQVYPEKDVFEVAEIRDREERRIANVLGITVKEARELLEQDETVTVVGFLKEGAPAFQNLSPSGFLSHLTAFSVP